MLALNQLAGFGFVPVGGIGPNPTIRYVGQYSYTFTSPAVTATATIPSGDLTLSGSNKQLVIAVGAELPVISNLTIDGVRAVMCCADVSQFVQIWNGPRVGSSNVSVVLTTSSAVNEAAAIQVWEVVDAAPVYEGFGAAGYTAIANANVDRYAPLGGSTMAMLFNAADTSTVTWTNVTEDADADVGTFRLSTAHTTTPVVSETRDTVSALSSAGTGRIALVTAIPDGMSCVRGTKIISTNLQLTTNTASTSTRGITDHENAGSFKLVVLIGYEIDLTVTGVTFDGVAMTLLGSVNNTGASPDVNLYAYGLDITQANFDGTLTITMSGSSPGTTLGVAMYRLYGVGSVGTAGSAQGNATGASFTVDVAEGGFILGLSVRATNTQTTTWTGLSEMIDIDNTFYAKSEAHRWNCSAETGRTIQAVGALGQYATLAIPFNP